MLRDHAQQVVQNSDAHTVELGMQSKFAMELMLATALRLTKSWRRDAEDQEREPLQVMKIIKKMLTHQYQLLSYNWMHGKAHGTEPHTVELDQQLPFAMDLMMVIVLKLMKL